MQEMVPVTIQMSAEKANLLSEIAAQRESTRDDLMDQVIEDYLARRREWLEGIDAAIRSVEAGHVVDAEELFAELENEFKL